MAHFLLDSSALILYSRRDPNAVTVVDRLLAAGEVLGVCPVVLAEFFSGLGPDRHQQWAAWVRALEFWPILRGDAIWAGNHRFAAARRGVQLSTPDSLIAAVARRMGASVVTSNRKDFARFPVEIREI